LTPAPPRTVPARWDGRRATVLDEKGAGRLWNRHAIGERGARGSLHLLPVEAAHALLHGWIEVHGDKGPVGLADLLTGNGAGTETQFLAYRDLRDRGLVVRQDGNHWAVWDRAKAPPEPPAYRVVAAAERDPVPVSELASWSAAGTVAAIVDDDADVTYYRLGSATPEGKCLPPEGRARARRLADRVLVEAHDLWSERVRPAGTRPVFLSLVEAEALAAFGRLDLPRGPAAPEALVRVAADLWRRGVIPRSGYRFGTHLRGYRDDPGAAHAEYLIHVASPGDRLPWTDISRGVRLAHGVRKRFLVAENAPQLRYHEVAWFRP